MAIKSQDTIGSQKSFYEQKNRNADTAIQILEDKIAILEEKNKSLEIENDSNKANREKLKKAIRELSESGNSSEKEISGYIRKNAELLEKINILQKEEKDNMMLRADFDTTKDELKMLRSSLKDKNYENEKLSKKIKDLEESMIEAKTKRADEFKELELLIKKELEVDKKMEMLRMQLQFNELQSENLKNLGVINKQSEEIAELKSKLKK